MLDAYTKKVIIRWLDWRASRELRQAIVVDEQEHHQLAKYFDCISNETHSLANELRIHQSRG